MPVSTERIRVGSQNDEGTGYVGNESIAVGLIRIAQDFNSLTAVEPLEESGPEQGAGPGAGAKEVRSVPARGLDLASSMRLVSAVEEALSQLALAAPRDVEGIFIEGRFRWHAVHIEVVEDDQPGPSPGRAEPDRIEQRLEEGVPAMVRGVRAVIDRGRAPADLVHEPAFGRVPSPDAQVRVRPARVRSSAA